MPNNKHMPFDDARIRAVFDAFPAARRGDLLRLRELILQTAHGLADMGEVLETLKWGQPAYLPARPRVGSTVRIGILKDDPDRYAMFFHCQTSLIAEFRTLYADRLAFAGNRAVILDHDVPVDEQTLRHCIARALTYHLIRGERRA